MKRRVFLKRTAAAGGSLAAILSPAGCNKAETIEYHPSSDTPAARLKHLENDRLSCDLFTDGSAKIIDKVNNIGWDIGPVAVQDEGPIDVGYVWVRTKRSFCEQYPGRFIAKTIGNHIAFTLLGRQNRIIGRLVCDISLEHQWLNFSIIEIDESLPSLVFPPPVICDSLVIPSGIGAWLRKSPEDNRFDREFYPFWSDLNMRWFDGIKDKSCWLAVFEQGMPDSGAMRVNRSISPVWLKCLGKWSPPFCIKYTFGKGSYVELAKQYRKWAIENGIFKSLNEKIDDNPTLRHYIGGRLLSFYQARPALTQRDADDLLLTKEQSKNRLGGKLRVGFGYADVLKAINKAKTLGFKNGPVIIRGWIKGGYDASHPDIWPPEPALGSIEELKDILSLHDPVVGGLHDNYQDMYNTTASFPKGVNRTADGLLMPAGFWAGGQAYAINSRNGLEFAKRNFEDIKSVSPRSMFIDTTTAMQLYQSYERGNKLTRAEDLKYKSELLRFYKDRGLLVGSEEGADFGIPYVDWFENRHSRIAGQYVPLWPLVFHDAAFCARYRPSVPSAGSYPSWLEDMLWGYFLLFVMDAEWKNQQQFTDTFHVDDWHKQIATAEMLSHRFLTEDYSVEETTFSTGQAIICNFTSQSVQIEGKTVPPNGYIIST